MIVKTLTSAEEAPPGRPRSEWDTQDFRDGVSGSLVVARLMSLDRRVEKGKDIIWTAMPGEKYFKACTRGLDRFNKDEFVLVRNDHRRVLTTIAVRQPTKIVSFCPTYRNPELDGDVVPRSRSLQCLEGQVAPDALG
jgi:hypothetical protein